MDRELKDLDDVDRALEEKPVEGVIERKRARRIANMRKRQKQEQLHEMLGLLGIPALVVVLIIIILILDRNPKNPDAQGGGPQVASSSEIEDAADDDESASPGIADGNAGADEDASLVRQYNDEYMTKLFQDYFNARLEGDTDTLYRLTGVTNQTEEQTASLQKKLKTQAGYIETYQDIQQYAVDGLEKNTKLVFVTYNVKFRRTDTLAPGIMYCYVKVNDQNSFEIVENMSPEQTKFVNNYITNHSEVQELINATNSRLLEAISSDQRLAVIYDAIQSGRIYTDSQEEIDSEVSLISVETEAAVTEAETTAPAGGDTANEETKESSKKNSDQKSSEKSTTETKKSTETTTTGETISENTGAGGRAETTAAAASGETIAEPGAADNAPAGDAVISDDGPVG